jgi:hypothetical protein
MAGKECIAWRPVPDERRVVPLQTSVARICDDRFPVMIEVPMFRPFTHLPQYQPMEHCPPMKERATAVVPAERVASGGPGL